MFNHSFKSKYKKCFIVCILVMAMLITASMPINAMEENEQPESNTEKITEVQAEAEAEVVDDLEAPVADDMEAVETVSADSQNKSNLPSEQTVQATESSEPVVSEPKQVEAADAGSQENEEGVMRALAPADYTKVTFDHNFDSSVLPTIPGSGLNEWQVVRGGYKGRYTKGQDVSAGFDTNANVSYSNDDAVRMTKNVVSTDTENEFKMYLNVEPQVSWEEILQLNTVQVSHNSANIDVPYWPSGGGADDKLSLTPTSTKKTPIKLKYYAMDNGRKLILAEIIMYCASNNVPNGSIAMGNPFLSGTFEDGTPKSFYYQRKFSLRATSDGSIPEQEVNISMLYAKYDFSTKKVLAQRVEDQVNNLIKVDENSFNYDGGSINYNGEVVNWTIPTQDLGVLPYTTDSSGNITPVGVKRTLPSGKVTYYRQEAYQMSYNFSLNVQDDKFVSAGSKDSTNDISKEYAIQTNKSPDDASDKEKGGKVTYTTNGQTGTGDFKSPYIKGLLYDLEFQKVVEGSKVPLAGVTFTIERQAGGSTYSEQIVHTDTKATGEDGWIKFHNLPWGTYTIKEISYKEGDVFQTNYLNTGDLPKELGTVRIGEVINPNALTENHSSGHSGDTSSDVKNRLFVFQNGTVENTPNRARITIIKNVNSYDSIPDALKSQKYTVNVKSTSEMKIYEKPGSQDDKLNSLDGQQQLGHQETVTYDLIVPKNGGTINLQEVIPESIKNKVVFDSATVTANAGSTDLGSVTEKNQGCEVTVLPGNDLTVTITNTPVGTVKIKKAIENYQKELAEDAFIIQAESVGDNGASVNTEAVLKHNESSGTITIKKTTTLNIKEIVPKEYSLSEITISGGGRLNGNQVIVNPGEDVIVTVHNSYSGKPFFHVADAIKNQFKSK